MQETFVIEAVTDKYKNKYNSGSVKAGGVWLQVASKLSLSAFQKDSEMTVETETNAKGYKSIVGLSAPDAVKRPTVAPEPQKAVKAPRTTTESSGAGKGVTVNAYENDKNRRIQVQGILQGVVQSPATINFGDDVEGIASKVLALADLLIAGMDARV
jgi:hypothetical protein